MGAPTIGRTAHTRSTTTCTARCWRWGRGLHSSGMAVRDLDGFGFSSGSDSGRFGRIPSSPAGEFFAVLYSFYGYFDPTEMGSGFGRIR